MPSTTPLPNKVRWTADEAGGVVVHTRDAFLPATMFMVVGSAAMLLGVLTEDSAPDDGFEPAVFAGIVVAFGVLFPVVVTLLAVNHMLLIDGGTVRHRWRRPIGATHEAPVSAFMILHAPGGDGPDWQLGVERADGTPASGLWFGDLPELTRLGTELHERTGLPFDPEPRPAGPDRRPSRPRQAPASRPSVSRGNSADATKQRIRNIRASAT